MEDLPQPRETVETDTVRIYGLSFNFPVTYELEFKPKSKREEGDLAIKSPTKSVIFVSWGDLRKVVKKLPNPAEHSRFSTERVAKSLQGKLIDVERKEMTVNGHAAVFTHAKVEMPMGLFGGKRTLEVESLHLHCENASRYYVIHTSFNPSRPKDPGHEDALEVVIDTFKCH
jgi:hypothetical protein